MSDLNPLQQLAVDFPHAQRLKIEAGPGTGKTHVLAERAARLVTDRTYRTNQMVLCTYTRAMAADLRRRVAAAMPVSMTCEPCAGLGAIDGLVCSACAGTARASVGELVVGTLHSVAARFVRQALAGTMPGGPGVLALGWLPADAVTFSFAVDEDLDDLAKHAQALVGKKNATIKALREGLRMFGAALESNPPAAELRRQLRQRLLITYDDVLVMFHRMICAADVRASASAAMDAVVGGGVAAAAVPLSTSYPCLMVDERQDLTPEHWSIIARWHPESLTAAGDTAQAIFGFLRGYDASDGAAIAWDHRLGLQVNYRSSGAVLGAIRPVRSALARDGACLDLDQVQGRDDAGFLWFRTPEDGVADTAGCAAAIIASGYAPEHIAILAATWADLGEVAAALGERGIPYHLPDTTGESRVWRSHGGRCVVAMARVAERGRVDHMDASILLQGLGFTTDGLADAVDEAYAHDEPLAGVLDRRYTKLGMPAAWWSMLTRGKTMREVRAALADVPAARHATVALDEWLAQDVAAQAPGDFLGWLASSEPPTPKPHAGVALRTIHGAKGLEWPVVIVHNACEGGIPPTWAKTAPQILEWGRALYVAMSRARDGLVVVSPRMLRGKERRPSGWLGV